MIKSSPMKTIKYIVILVVLALYCDSTYSQAVNSYIKNDSINAAALKNYYSWITVIDSQISGDSIIITDLKNQLNTLSSADSLQRESLSNRIRVIEFGDRQLISERKAKHEILRMTASGYPVTGVGEDTLFYVFSKIGASTPRERATNITSKIKLLYNDDFLKLDSIHAEKSKSTFDIVCEGMIIMSISRSDAIWYDKSMPELADEFSVLIRDSISAAKKDRSILKLFLRIGLVILVLGLAWLIIWAIGKGYKRMTGFIGNSKEKWLKNL
jgi:hypothetical protein